MYNYRLYVPRLLVFQDSRVSNNFTLVKKITNLTGKIQFAKEILEGTEFISFRMIKT